MKVGDYVRTNKGYIARINKITELTIICDGIVYPFSRYGFHKQLNKESLKRLQVKSSPNIIDLIEVGDYVNGYKVDKVEERYIWFGDERLTLAYKFNYDKYSIKTENIKSIVTKEQFESMEYKIGE